MSANPVRVYEAKLAAFEFAWERRRLTSEASIAGCIAAGEELLVAAREVYGGTSAAFAEVKRLVETGKVA